jgi:hypothetical protein
MFLGRGSVVARGSEEEMDEINYTPSEAKCWSTSLYYTTYTTTTKTLDDHHLHLSDTYHVPTIHHHYSPPDPAFPLSILPFLPLPPHETDRYAHDLGRLRGLQLGRSIWVRSAWACSGGWGRGAREEAVGG